MNKPNLTYIIIKRILYHKLNESYLMIKDWFNFAKLNLITDMYTKWQINIY